MKSTADLKSRMKTTPHLTFTRGFNRAAPVGLQSSHGRPRRLPTSAWSTYLEAQGMLLFLKSAQVHLPACTVPSFAPTFAYTRFTPFGCVRRLRFHSIFSFDNFL